MDRIFWATVEAYSRALAHVAPTIFSAVAETSSALKKAESDLETLKLPEAD
jgi:hypothetical protein